MDTAEWIEKARKAYLLKVVKVDLGWGATWSVPVSLALALLFGQFPNLYVWLTALFVFFAAAWGSEVINRIHLKPDELLFEHYDSLIKREPRLRGLISARLLQSVDDIDTSIRQLTGSPGERWEQEDRFQAANNLMTQVDSITRYWATSTDAPFKSLAWSDLFYQRQKSRLKHADVRRLLTFPLDLLLKNLEIPENRINLRKFLAIHHRSNFHLRYWPIGTRQLENALRNQFLATNAKTNPILVDMAVVGESLVFGQSAGEKDGSDNSVNGNGFIFTSPLAVDGYSRVFGQLWSAREDVFQSAAQLDAYLRLIDMRQNPPSGPVPDLRGEEYFKQVLCRIAESSSLRAIDLAPDTRMWFEKVEYRSFLDATILAARNNPENFFGRAFVLPPILQESDAGGFIELVVRPQIEVGIHVYILRNCTLVQKDIAGFDCIFGPEWGFYLLPSDSFRSSEVNSAKNTLDSSVISYYAARVFSDLQRNSAHSFSKLSDLDPDALFEYLVHPPDTETEEH